MATFGNVLSIMDWAKRTDGTGKTASIVEMLSQVNEILMDMLFIEGNLPTGNRSVLRTSLPTVENRILNQGVTPSKSTTVQVDDNCATLEAWSEVDCKLAGLGGDVSGFRLSEAQSFVESMSQEMASQLFYSSTSVNPEAINGLSTRYSSSTGTNGSNVLKAGSADTDNSSIWLIVWGNGIHGMFPKGSQAGLKHEDLGEETAETSASVGGTRLRVYRDKFSWDYGLVVKDWRNAVRICNIDISNLVGKSSAPDLFDYMIKATHRIPNLSAGKAAFYMNRSCLQSLDIQSRDDVQTGGQLGYENVDGKPVLSFRGIPIRKVDALLENETAVS